MVVTIISYTHIVILRFKHLIDINYTEQLSACYRHLCKHLSDSATSDRTRLFRAWGWLVKGPCSFSDCTRHSDQLTIFMRRKMLMDQLTLSALV